MNIEILLQMIYKPRIETDLTNWQQPTADLKTSFHNTDKGLLLLKLVANGLLLLKPLDNGLLLLMLVEEAVNSVCFPLSTTIDLICLI